MLILSPGIWIRLGHHCIFIRLQFTFRENFKAVEAITLLHFFAVLTRKVFLFIYNIIFSDCNDDNGNAGSKRPSIYTL